MAERQMQHKHAEGEDGEQNPYPPLFLITDNHDATTRQTVDFSCGLLREKSPSSPRSQS